MTQFDFHPETFTQLDAFEIERKARIEQSRLIGAFVRRMALAFASRLHLTAAPKSA